MADNKKQQNKQVKKVVKKTAKAVKKSKHPALTVILLILVVGLIIGSYFVINMIHDKQVEEAKQEEIQRFNNEKNAAIDKINNCCKDESLYSDNGLKKIKALREEAINKINQNESIKGVQDIAKEYEEKIKKVKTLEQEINGLCDELQIHVLQLDNWYAGDCIYIKAGDVDILVDAGSIQGSAAYIEEYIDQYVTDGKLEYVIATHADKDHIAAFVGPKKDGKYETGIFGYYECGLIIDFPQTTKTTEIYNNYVTLRDQEVANGATRYTALQCYNETDGAKRKYQLTDTIELEILYNYYYDHETTNENNFSVCFMINQGDKHFLFTGDLENEGKAEEYLVQYNELPEVDFMKAGHHGSQTSSSVALLNQVKPKTMAISCVAGSTEYTKTAENTFPAQSSISRIATVEGIKVYCTRQIVNDEEHEWAPLNGTIVITSDGIDVVVNCSNNNTELKDSDWFKANREWK